MRDLLRRLRDFIFGPYRYPAKGLIGDDERPCYPPEDPMDGVQGPDPRPVQTLGELLRRTR